MSTVIQPPTENKAQRAERLKREKNPWEALDEVRSFAPRGFSAVPDAWLKTYFRWWGIYTQGDGAGALGGSGGEGRSVPYFMLRIRLENGFLNSLQLRGIASLAERHARGIADITVRQNIQLHWLSTEDLPLVMETLFQHGLTSQSTCGDVTRNITGCPLAGINAHEPFDASPLAFGASQMLVGNPEFYNLPRKYKISISGCPDWCSYPEINDVAFTPAMREGENGFSLRVGGGLSTEPHLALKLNAFVPWNQVLAVLTAVTEIFREADCLRENRERARLKYLFLRHGWTPDSFLQEVERRLGFRLAPAGEETVPADVYRDHSGVHPQKQSGLSYVGAAVLRGRITPEQMRAAANLADRHGSGDLRTTNTQNLVIINVPRAETGQVVAGLEAVGLHVEASTFWRGAVACTGTEFCKLAITETKGYTRWLVEELEERLPGFDQQIKINVTGCPNSCGQHRLADIGLEGKKIKVGGRMTDAYYFCLGGAVGQGAALARPIGYRCAAEQTPEAIERLMREYLRRRVPGENLRRFFARHSEADLRAFLAGEEQEAVLRDTSPGRPAHELEA
ncbi:MAG TPA: nitrite/sulfite reductase [Candidatus Saccharimonadales bacterium]|jgi:sulfite reductase (ferredoxin)|nr:nitrite/sulfite reductase [Candidatus Saccharimonadales bacterium]